MINLINGLGNSTSSNNTQIKSTSKYISFTATFDYMSR